MVNLVLQQRNSGCAVLKWTGRQTADCSSSLRGVTLYRHFFQRCIKRFSHGLTIKGGNTTAPDTVFKRSVSEASRGSARWDRKPTGGCRHTGALFGGAFAGRKTVIQRLFNALWCGGGAGETMGQRSSRHVFHRPTVY